MNIGIACYPTVGGSGAVAAELGKQLARRGHAVHFVSYRLPFRLEGFQENISYHELDLSTYSLFEYPPHDLSLAAKMAEVEEALAALDPTLRAAADSARGRALHQIESLHEKSVRALKKKDQTRADRLRRTRDALLPGGSFQERGLGVASLVSRYGTAVIAEIAERVDLFAKGHQILQL